MFLRKLTSIVLLFFLRDRYPAKRQCFKKFEFFHFSSSNKQDVSLLICPIFILRIGIFTKSFEIGFLLKLINQNMIINSLRKSMSCIWNTKLSVLQPWLVTTDLIFLRQNYRKVTFILYLDIWKAYDNPKNSDSLFNDRSRSTHFF